MRYLALALLLGVATAGASAQEIEWVEDDICGRAAEIDGYEIELGGLDFSFPRDLQIVINGKIVLEDGRSEGWRSFLNGKWIAPYNGIQVAETNDHLLIFVFYNDCIDGEQSRLFMFSKQGEFILSQAVWTHFQEDAFYYEGKNLVYWSEWFCHENNEMYSAESSYVYVQSGHEKFRKDVRPTSLLCASETITSINRREVEFTYLDPEIYGRGVQGAERGEE